MCGFLSFVIAEKNGKARIYSDPSLSSHGEAIDHYGLDENYCHEVVWDDDDEIEVRLATDEPDGKAGFYEEWIRKRYGSRQQLINMLCDVHLGEGRLPYMLHYKHENWNERIMRLFACDCAEHVLQFYEQKYPDDKRPRRAIEIARKFAKGEATQKELHDVWNAARDANVAATVAAFNNTDTENAWDTTRFIIACVARAAEATATWDTAYGDTTDAPVDAAWEAAWHAAREASMATGNVAARGALKDIHGNGDWLMVKEAVIRIARQMEEKWQVNRLKKYLENA